MILLVAGLSRLPIETLQQLCQRVFAPGFVQQQPVADELEVAEYYLSTAGRRFLQNSVRRRVKVKAS